MLSECATLAPALVKRDEPGREEGFTHELEKVVVFVLIALAPVKFHVAVLPVIELGKAPVVSAPFLDSRSPGMGAFADCVSVCDFSIN